MILRPVVGLTDGSARNFSQCSAVTDSNFFFLAANAKSNRAAHTPSRKSKSEPRLMARMVYDVSDVSDVIIPATLFWCRRRL